MSNFPAKGWQSFYDNAAFAAAEAAKATEVDAAVNFYTDEIIKAMIDGQLTYQNHTGIVPAVLRRLAFELKEAGWTVSSCAGHTGCTISWS